MIRVSVKCPTKTNKYFSYSVKRRLGGGAMKATNAVRIFTRIKNRVNKYVLMGAGKVKINLKVVYGRGVANKGEYASKREALYALLCFMEDYLPADYVKDKEHKYSKKVR